jgi:hypothetical protein
MAVIVQATFFSFSREQQSAKKCLQLFYFFSLHFSSPHESLNHALIALDDNRVMEN